MNYRLIIFIIIVLNSLSKQGLSQDMDSHLKEFITTKDGLPSNEVYHIIQDQNNYLWFATDNGIVKYDGNSFKIFNSNDGLPNNTVFRFYEQPDGKIYGETLYNQYFYIENDSIHQYPYNNIISEYISSTRRCHSFYIDSLSNTHIGSTYGSITINKNGEPISLDCIKSNTKNIGVLKFKDFGDYIFTYNAYLKDSLDSTFGIRKLTPNQPIIYQVDKGSSYSESNYATKVDNNKVAIMFQGKVFLLDSTKILSQIKPKNNPVGVFMIDSLLWICTRKEGVTAYRIVKDSLTEVDHFLDGHTVTSVIKDNENGYWFSTLEHGIIHIYDFDLIKIFEAEMNQNISAFCVGKKNSFIGFDDGTLIDLENPLINLNLKQQIKSIKKWGSNNFLFFTGGGSFKYTVDETNRLKRVPITYTTTPQSYLDVLNINDSLVLIYTMSDLKVYNKNTMSIVYSSDYNQISEKILSACIYQNSILLATTKGLILFNKADYSFDKTIPLPSSVVALSVLNNKLVVACRNGNIYSYNGKSIDEIGLQKDNTISRIFDVKTVNQMMIVATNLGIEKYLYDQKKGSWYSYEFINLPGVINIQLSDNTIYYVTKKEIYLDKNNIRNNNIPRVEIVDFKVNGNTFTLDSNIQLTYNQNNLQFKINSISYSSEFKQFKYKAEGVNQDYLFTSDPNINYASLVPGDYKFIVSSTANGIDYSTEVHYSFTILPPFWKTNWFISTAILLGLLILIFIYYRQIQKIKIKSALKESIAQLKSQALTSQLNPHLVFNILNSIQGLISEEETEKANIYLAKFSKFMRSSLSASKKMKVSLDEEVKITKSYIELEMLRFPNNVSITLTNNATNSNYYLPPLILQPFIENAIKHGIMPSKKEHGIIKIIINELDEYLLISIEDNGAGFNGPINFSSGDGMRISKERLEIQNPKNEIYLDNNNDVTRIIIKAYL